jgi:hypothetical protein
MSVRRFSSHAIPIRQGYRVSPRRGDRVTVPPPHLVHDLLEGRAGMRRESRIPSMLGIVANACRAALALGASVRKFSRKSGRPVKGRMSAELLHESGPAAWLT